MAVREEKGSVGLGGRQRKKTGGGWVSTWQSSINDILPSQSELRGFRRRCTSGMTLRCTVFWAAESETYTRSRYWAENRRERRKVSSARAATKTVKRCWKAWG